jgi:hypothetical protein
MRSLSTSAFGQPSETKLTFGAAGFLSGSSMQHGANRERWQAQGRRAAQRFRKASAYA